MNETLMNIDKKLAELASKSNQYITTILMELSWDGFTEAEKATALSYNTTLSGIYNCSHQARVDILINGDYEQFTGRLELLEDMLADLVRMRNNNDGQSDFAKSRDIITSFTKDAEYIIYRLKKMSKEVA